MATGPFFLGIDAGQTVVKAVLHDHAMQKVAVARGASPNHTPAARRVERSHDDLWSAANTAITEVLALSGVNPSEIQAIGITGHGDGFHLVDAEGGAVGPAIMAVDSRAWREREDILADADRSQTILEMSGQVPFLGSPGIMLAWTAKNHPEFLTKAHAMLGCKDVLRLRLTGHIGTDFSDASASFLNTRTSQWSQELLDAYGVGDQMRLLPSLHSSVEVVGTISPDAAALTGLTAGTPVVAGSHDVHASALGMGSLRDGALSLIAGSFSINAVTTTTDYVHPDWQNRLSVEPGLRMAMSTSATASTTLEWFLSSLGITSTTQRDALFQEAQALEPSDDLPVLTPFLFASPYGEAPSGSFVGLRNWHTPAHLLRSTLEGIAWMHVWHCNALSRSFQWDPVVRLGGGIANSEFYSDMVANALGVTIEVVSNDETGCFGAAAMAATGVGYFQDYREAFALVEVERTHTPHDDGVAYWKRRSALLQDVTDALMPIWTSWNQGS
jgi:L-xylulokinase